MNKNIKIMNPHPPVSDEEIRSFMDFDGLLRKHKSINANTRYRQLKWAIVLAGVAVIAVLTFTVATLTHDAESKISTHHLKTTETPIQSVVPDTTTATLKLEQKMEERPVADQPVTRPATKTPESNSLNNDVQSGDLHNSKTSRIETEDEKEDPYIQAEPAGGYEMLYDYFNKNLNYPIEAVKDSVQGVITVSFVITNKGTTENIEFKKSLGEPFEHEALKLIREMPPWKPATLNGKPVSSRIVLPLTFSITTVK